MQILRLLFSVTFAQNVDDDQKRLDIEFFDFDIFSKSGRKPQSTVFVGQYSRSIGRTKNNQMKRRFSCTLPKCTKWLI